MTSTVMLVLMVIPSAIPLLVAAHHYCWLPLKTALSTTCSPTCCGSGGTNGTEYAPVDRHDPASNTHEMLATSTEQPKHQDQP